MVGSLEWAPAHFGAILPFGVSLLAVDGPGTGQAPIKVSENSERLLSKVIDYAQTRPDVDRNRIALHGVSWGAYWATKMAIVAPANYPLSFALIRSSRIRSNVSQSTGLRR